MNTAPRYRGDLYGGHRVAGWRHHLTAPNRPADVPMAWGLKWDTRGA